MKKILNSAIMKLEQIPVAGVNAILMGDALKELFLAREQAPEPEEGEKNVNSND